MYSERIDTAINGIKEYTKDLKTVVRDICKAIAKIGKCETVNVSYYTDSEIGNWTFFDCDSDGYGMGLYLAGISRLTDDPVFYMNNDNGFSAEERDIDDFSESEVSWLAQMLNDLYNVIADDGKVEEMPKRRVRY